MEKPPHARTQFKTGEGRYALWSERTAGLVPFANGRATRLTLAALRGGAEQGQYMVFNVAEHLHICAYDGTDKEPLRSLVLNPAAVRDGHPHAHAFSADARDGLDLVVATAGGEGVCGLAGATPHWRMAWAIMGGDRDGMAEGGPGEAMTANCMPFLHSLSSPHPCPIHLPCTALQST